MWQIGFLLLVLFASLLMAPREAAGCSRQCNGLGNVCRRRADCCEGLYCIGFDPVVGRFGLCTD
ncbi:hypothetical protein BOX15_Mlig018955g1 [Macrostomum lignano]|uniref:Uncharacterized protein n=1 Tax=Macrostomum lignano TaxID=282301 RepID=A0A267FEB7_9PLAT|nr:hypothetical protein BOX15_Mlig019895g3 [Macrostomum lignano]PAA71507.1 hypothetical protein BOX15_Mlig019895g2 [Macrostomum lignano]PAA92185.1 hypothetical protein BOX15_Mlig018955g1 [Macrostomum lignano]